MYYHNKQLLILYEILCFGSFKIWEKYLFLEREREKERD